MSPRKVSRSERIKVSREQHDLALRRTDFLLRMTDRPLQDLIANAWIQGVLDAAEHTALKANPDDRGSLNRKGPPIYAGGATE